MAMGLVLNAATGRGWTTGSGMEGPSIPVGIETETGTANVSTFPWSLFTKSPRRRMLVAFTCNICRQRTTRAINPHAYTDGTVFVQVIIRKHPHLYGDVRLNHGWIKKWVFAKFISWVVPGMDQGNSIYLGEEDESEVRKFQDFSEDGLKMLRATNLMFWVLFDMF